MKLTPLTITELGNPVLRKKARRVRKNEIATLQFQELVNRMFVTMHLAPGVGLAAPQVGIPVQLAVLEVYRTQHRPKVKPFPPTVLVNPRILRTSREKYEGWEGCLSFVHVRGKAVRHKWIEVEFWDRFGVKQKLRVSGFPAEVFQHEIDHLNGIVYLDRMKDLRSLMTLAEFDRQAKKS